MSVIGAANPLSRGSQHQNQNAITAVGGTAPGADDGYSKNKIGESILKAPTKPKDQMRTDPKTNNRAVDKRLAEVARLYLKLQLSPEKAQHAAKADLRDIARFHCCAWAS
jgi:hypothetical protein